MILITEFMDEAAVDRLRQFTETVYEPGLADRQGDIPALATNAEALIVRNRTQVTTELLQAAPKLKCVGRLGVGLDNIDQRACTERGVSVYPATGANNLSVAEYVITTAMMLLRGAYQAHEAMMGGDWPRLQCSGREIAGKTLGLIGFGAIARQTAAMARALGLRVTAYDPFLPPDDPAWEDVANAGLDVLLSRADVVSLHTPLTAETRHLINAERLSSMKQDAVLINAARGGVVDEPALVDALSSGRIGGAALDVFETEPLTKAAAETFRDVPNLVLTPHIAGVTAESNERVSALIADRIIAHLSGEG